MKIHAIYKNYGPYGLGQDIFLKISLFISMYDSRTNNIASISILGS